MPFDEVMKPQEAIEREDDSLGVRLYPDDVSVEVEGAELFVAQTEPDSGEDYTPAYEISVEIPNIITPEPTPGRRRRRAASTGVITPGA